LLEKQNNMIAQKNRLSSRADFGRIFKNGNKISNQYCNIRYLVNQLGYCRFAVIVSNKISSKAAERNQIKRRIKAILIKNLFKFSKNFDIVVTVLPALKGLKYQDVEEIFLNLFKKQKILL
jgi:ribonuclease P protein component